MESRPSLWRRYLQFPLIWKMLIGLALGVAAGLVFGESIDAIEPLGTIFLNLLQMVVFPVIVLTLVTGVASVAPSTLGKTGLKVVGLYMVTSAVAITLGITLAMLAGVGKGLSMPSEGGEPADTPSVWETVVGIVPSNPFSDLAEGKVLPIVFIALLVGFAVGAMRHASDEGMSDKGDLLFRIAEAGSEVMHRLIRGILEYAPIGVFALIAVTVGTTGPEALTSLAGLVGVVYGGVALEIGFYALLLFLFGYGVKNFFTHAKTPMLTAFVTRSSSGTLPVSLEAARKMGVPNSVSGFSLPLGATINMDGTALYVGASVVFVANVAGVDLTTGALLSVVLVGMLAAIGTAGVPGAGLIMLSLAISQAGLPFAPVVLVAGIDALLDMARTGSNVTGDLAVTRIAAGKKLQKEKAEAA
ncbi:dicarboxylate/amino acid:cation symporter [Salininema proteolyticum]|uniref:Dicarboxylate/amino acid:cation symporter n=1 Tax=Salininema proteolyticum TaxID=1607685 RepID=A0ABV8U121_9ACTN